MSIVNPVENKEEVASAVEAILFETCPDECEVAGDAIVRQISQGKTHFADAPGGHFLGLHPDAIAALIAAMNVVVGFLKVTEEAVKLSAARVPQATIDAKREEGIAATKKQSDLPAHKLQQILQILFPDRR